MRPASTCSPSIACAAGKSPARLRIAGRTLVPPGGRWSTTNTADRRSVGRPLTTLRRASTPPAEAPMTMTPCPFDCPLPGTNSPFGRRVNDRPDATENSRARRLDHRRLAALGPGSGGAGADWRGARRAQPVGVVGGPGDGWPRVPQLRGLRRAGGGDRAAARGLRSGRRRPRRPGRDQRRGAGPAGRGRGGGAAADGAAGARARLGRRARRRAAVEQRLARRRARDPAPQRARARVRAGGGRAGPALPRHARGPGAAGADARGVDGRRRSPLRGGLPAARGARVPVAERIERCRARRRDEQPVSAARGRAPPDRRRRLRVRRPDARAAGSVASRAGGGAGARRGVRPRRRRPHRLVPAGRLAVPSAPHGGTRVVPRGLPRVRRARRGRGGAPAYAHGREHGPVVRHSRRARAAPRFPPGRPVPPRRRARPPRRRYDGRTPRRLRRPARARARQRQLRRRRPTSAARRRLDRLARCDRPSPGDRLRRHPDTRDALAGAAPPRGLALAVARVVALGLSAGAGCLSRPALAREVPHFARELLDVEQETSVVPQDEDSADDRGDVRHADDEDRDPEDIVPGGSEKAVLNRWRLLERDSKHEGTVGKTSVAADTNGRRWRPSRPGPRAARRARRLHQRARSRRPRRRSRSREKSPSHRHRHRRYTMTLNIHQGSRLWLAAAVAALSATLVLLFSAGHSDGAHASMTRAPQFSPKAVAFRSAMDKLWEDHVTWTRMVIVDFAAGLPDLQTAEARLLRNQVDIGNAIKPYYGAAAGRKLTSLLRTHILEAVPVLAAAKAGDKARLTQSLNAWYANANEIAAFLSKANRRNWPLRMMTSMMRQHLALTTKEAVARLQGNWTADVRAYDQVHAEILGMSHMLSTGIIRQFPSRF